MNNENIVIAIKSLYNLVAICKNTVSTVDEIDENIQHIRGIINLLVMETNGVINVVDKNTINLVLNENGNKEKINDLIERFKYCSDLIQINTTTFENLLGDDVNIEDLYDCPINEDTECLNKESTVRVVLDGSDLKYTLNNNGTYIEKYGVGYGKYILKNVPVDYPVALLNRNKQHIISYKGSDFKKITKEVFGTYNDGIYDFYYGDVEVFVEGDFGNISLYCHTGGYMGGLNMLTYLDSCTYVDFHQEIILRKGWNYISFNIKPSFDSMVLSDSIKNSNKHDTTQPKLVIKNNSKFSVYDDDTFHGDIDIIDYSKTHAIYLNVDLDNTVYKIIITGAYIKRSPLKFEKDWNWYGYNRFTTKPIEDIFTSPIVGDKILRIENDETKKESEYSNVGWIGDVTKMEPGKGYIYKSSDSVGELDDSFYNSIYNSVYINGQEVIVSTTDLCCNTTIVLSVKCGGVTRISGNIIARDQSDTIIGISGNPVLINNNYLFFLLVILDPDEEEFEPKLQYLIGNKYYEISSLGQNLISDKHLGSVSTPINLNIIPDENGCPPQDGSGITGGTGERWNK